MKTLCIDIFKSEMEAKFYKFRNRKSYKTMKTLIKFKMKLMKGGEFFFNDEDHTIITRFKDETLMNGFIKELVSNVESIKSKGLNIEIEIKYK